MNKKIYDIKTLQDYLAGKLDSKAMHALERQALEDPLLQEALEGLEGNPDLQQGDMDRGMERLTARLNNRVAGIEERSTEMPLSGEVDKDGSALMEAAPVTPLYGNKTRNKFKWWSVAAVVLVLIAGGWFYFAVDHKETHQGAGSNQIVSLNGQDTGNAGDAGNEVASAINKVLEDTNNHNERVNNLQGSTGAVAKMKGIKSATEKEYELKRENSPAPGLTALMDTASGSGKIALSGPTPLKEVVIIGSAAPTTNLTAESYQSLTRSKLHPKAMAKANLAPADLTRSNPLSQGQIRSANQEASLLSRRSAAAAKLPYDSMGPLPGALATAKSAGDTQAQATLLAKTRPVAADQLLTSVLPDLAKKDSHVAINDVVIVGYGGHRKKNITGAVTSANNINIRGIGAVMDSVSPDKDNGPLWVVDGKPIKKSEQSKINPKDIDKVTVLKEPAATAVYGASGDNGVIVIATKKYALAKDKDSAKATGRQGDNKMANPTHQDFSKGLAGQIPGIRIMEENTYSPVLKVHISRISGHLLPKDGFVPLKRYLENKVANDLWRGKLSRYDTGKVYLEVHLESKDYGKGVVIKPTTRLIIFPWLMDAINEAPPQDWQYDKGYKGKDSAGPTKIMVEISTK